ncbi:hypothetical protein A33Q_1159 [Indibacter alkaliphilus LW1]|uniref:Uncharacterized protein n=1 Tax=Indibacter alkaliphilus (strain CCUG 57479 / KCTC 22604 / LW1) TaxID=1189612 RepID=S2DMS8_INDAL|nr:hypothetical protein A33Q_1159 [Indibacter alkaliphilus LW1]
MGFDIISTDTKNRNIQLPESRELIPEITGFFATNPGKIFGIKIYDASLSLTVLT